MPHTGAEEPAGGARGNMGWASLYARLQYLAASTQLNHDSVSSLCISAASQICSNNVVSILWLSRFVEGEVSRHDVNQHWLTSVTKLRGNDAFFFSFFL